MLGSVKETINASSKSDKNQGVLFYLIFVLLATRFDKGFLLLVR